MIKQHDSDSDILGARAIHPIAGEMYFERTRQDRRTYYRAHHGNRTAGLTDAKHARETVQYWIDKGWIVKEDN